jgi:Zn-dependent protease with chaperone function
MSKRSLASRAVLAVTLMIGFYALALIIAGTLLFIPVAEWVFADRIHIRLALFCIVGGLAILWSVIPRPDRFTAPGPLLDPTANPELFKQLRDVAGKTGQEMPHEVYVVPEVNAWVTQRGGFMGFRSRPVMGLGLPLMQILSVSQFRGVIGHEFGHYHGGDTKLGPWIYKTREAIGRTLENLGKHSSALQKPFVWYGNFFMRITQTISREQELHADALAARIVGPGNTIAGLREVHRAAVAFDSYWSGEVVPVLDGGYRPAIAEGFRHFVSGSLIAPQLSSLIEDEMKEGQSDVYDSHPPLRERVAAIEALKLSRQTWENDTRAAVALIGDLAALELELLASLANDPEKVHSLKPVRWEETANAVFLPKWRDVAIEQKMLLDPVVVGSMNDPLRNLDAFAHRLTIREPESIDDEQRKGYALYVLGSAFATALAKNDWTFVAAPGEPTLFRRGEESIDPFALVNKLHEDDAYAAAWEQESRRLGVAQLSLAPGGDV